MVAVESILAFANSYPVWARVVVSLCCTVIILTLLLAPRMPVGGVVRPTKDDATKDTAEKKADAPEPRGHSSPVSQDRVIQPPAAKQPQQVSQATFGHFSPAVNAGGDVTIIVNKPDAELTYVPPVVNAFRGHHNNSTYVKIAEGVVPITLSKEPTEPIDGIWDYIIEFDLINRGKTDIKISRLYLEVVSVDQLEAIENYLPLAGLGEARKYVCRFEGRVGRYPCEFNNADQYVFLKAGEHETIQLAVNTKDEGKFHLRVIGEWSTSAGLKTENVGEVPNVRILNRARISSLPRERR